jgi:pimeloyl-ACP methyl ester carboxylesterase
MARVEDLDGADVEYGFESLAKGSLDGNGKSRRKSYRSKSRRYRQALLHQNTNHKSCLTSLGGKTVEGGGGENTENNFRERSRLLCERILRLDAEKSRFHHARSMPFPRQEAARPDTTGESHFYSATSTGMKIHYLEWGEISDQVVILLHGLGESAQVWSSIASKLASHGFHVYSLDLRGHGMSTWSSDRIYNPRAMASDLKDFALEFDLYKQPFALVGANIGAAVATDFAASYPRLVGLLACVDYNPTCKDSRLTYCKVQGVKSVQSSDAAISLLTSPLLKEQQRTLASARKLVSAIFRQGGDTLGLKPRMDPDFAFCATPASLGHSLACVKQCQTLFLHCFGCDQIEGIAQMNDKITFAKMNKSCGFSVSDSGFEVYSELKKLLVESNGEIFAVADSSARTAEGLGLRPLPQFNSLEEAFKALGPRKIPTREAIESELAKLRTEEGYLSSDDDEKESQRSHKTSLSSDPSDYFGFVG